ncbi:hemagglutinin repeat-containing protein, partial [Avibacterium avium]
MNKKSYRVIFSKTLNQLIVVSELARTQGKATSENVVAEKIVQDLTALCSRFNWAMKPVQFSMMVALGYVYFATPAFANEMAIRADKSAPANQQATILKTANGLPQVNIQTPSQAGVSRNTYSQFDVAEKGAVLNNARKATSTQLAGWVQGNPNLATGEAKVILNEVNSNNPSHLKGYIEVAGKKADVVIANPSGIHCEGCGVINAGRSTFTTGKPEIANGELKGYQVKGGKVSVTGKGLDNRQVDYTDIIAEKVQLEGGVWAKQLKVTTGKNKVNRTNDAVVYVGNKNNEKNDRTLANSEYRIDVSELGGMYAERIQLVDNGSGLGVRNAGHIGASVGEVQIDSQGKILNSGNIQAVKGVNIGSNTDIENSASAKLIAQQGNIQLKSENAIKQSGTIAAKNTVKVKSQSLEQTKQAEILGENINIETKEALVNRGLINGRSTEDKIASTVIKASKITNIGTGRIYSDHLAIGAEKLENLDEQDGQLSSAVIAARKQLDLGVNHLLNQSRYYTGDTDTASTIMSLGSLNIGKALDSQNNLTGQADSLYNRSALIQAEEGSWNVAQVHNINDFFQTEMREVSNKSVNWRYIVPEGWAESEHRIDGGLMRMESGVRGKSWNVFYRAPKREEIEKPENGDVLSNFLPEVNLCSSGECELRAAEYYFPNDPVWRAFAINTQQSDAVLDQLSQAKVPVAPIAPVEPREPQRTDFKGRRAQKRYENALEKYQQALSDYQKEKSAYTLAYANYQQEKQAFDEKIKPLYFKWMKDNRAQFIQLKDKITAHNNFLYSERGKEYKNFWVTHITNQVIKADTVTQSQPGKIVFGGNLGVNAASFINDKSQILIGEKLHLLSADVENRNVEGQQITQNFGDRYFSYLAKRKSKSGSGRNKYRRKNTSHASGLLSTQTQSITLPVANLYEQYDFTLDPVGKIDTGNQGVLPSSSLYKINPDSANNVLIETDPQFTDRRKWLSSDYMFNALRTEPQNILKRLGDGYYEQQLVRNQLNQITGRVFLGNNQRLEEQYKTLMDNGVTFAKRFNVTPGITLTAAQVAKLTTDIVWFEPQTVTLPSGKKVEVIAPRVYVVAKEGDLNDKGALISANIIDLRATGLRNTGAIEGRQIALLNTDTLYNKGDIQADKVEIKTTKNLDNIGGRIEAENTLFIDVGGDLNHQSTVSTTKINNLQLKRSESTLDRKALLYVKGENGQLHLSAKNILSQGAEIINNGKEATLISAKNGINLTALSVGFDEKMGQGDHYRKEKIQNAVVSTIKGKGNVTLEGKSLTSEGAVLESEARLMAIAENNLVLNGAQNARQFEEFHQIKTNGLLAKESSSSLDKQQSETYQGTQINGDEVQLIAGGNIKAKGLQAVSQQDFTIQANQNVEISADTNHFQDVHLRTKKKSGVFASGIGITFGSQSEKHRVESEGWTQSDARSTLGSINGNVTLQAGKQVNVLGADIITPQKNHIEIAGASVKMEAGKDIVHTQENHEYKQSGLTISVSTPVTDLAQQALQTRQQAQQVSNPKLKALYAIKAAQEATMAIQNVSKVAETIDALQNGAMQHNGTTANPSIKLSLSYGNQKQTQYSESQSVTHQQSSLNTGTLTVKAQEDNIVFEGVDAKAKHIALAGKTGIDIRGVADTYRQKTENRTTGSSVGVFVGTNGDSYGIGVEGSVNVAKGKSNLERTTWQNSHLTAESLITTQTEGDLTLDAANLASNRWEAAVNNLHLISRQDSESYRAKQISAGASGSVAYGSGGSASANGSYQNAQVDYAQVNEQAGISVGEGGMDVKVHQHTQLDGAIIESNAEKEANHFSTESFGHRALTNYSKLKTESASLSVGSGGINPMQGVSSALSLLGNRQENKSSQTKAAVSGNIQIETKTPENLPALSRDTAQANERVGKADLGKVQEQQEMAKVIGNIADNSIAIATYNQREEIARLKREKAKVENQQGKESPQAQALNTQIQQLEKNLDTEFGIGSAKGMAIRAVTAALQSAVQNDSAGALTALASPYLNQVIHQATEGNREANLMAHALLSAVEFAATGKDPITGAIAGVTGEATAQYLTKALYNKTPNELTASEKENISTLSQLAGGLAGAFTAKTTGNTPQQGGSFLSAVAGAETAKRAVENNFFDYSPQDIEVMEINGKASELKKEINEKVIEDFEKEHPELVENLRRTGDVASFLADLTPVGSVKSFAEAEDGVDYLLATVGLIPGSNIVTKPLKGAKQAFKKAKEAEELGNISETIGYLNKASEELEKVKALDVGSYKNLKRRSTIGDNLDLDHIPSFAALKKAKENELGRKLLPKEEKILRDEATTVAVPKDIHFDSRTFGGKNNKQKIMNDANNLCLAQQCDLNKMRSSLIEKGYDIKDINNTINEIIRINKERGI